MPLTIAMVAFAVRGALLYGTGLYRSTPAIETNNVAQAIAAGLGIANPYGCPTGATGHLAPLFPLFSGGLLVLTGEHWGIAKALASITVVSLLWASMPYASQTLGFTRTAGAMPYASQTLGFTRTAGAIAGFAGAFLPLAISTELRGDWEAPYVAAGLLLAAIYAIRLEKGPIPRKAAGVRHGICWGALMLTLPGAILLLPGWLWRVSRNRFRSCTPYAMALVGATALTVVPYIVFSRVHVGHWFFIRNNLGLELFVSNHPDSALLMIDNMPKAMARYHPLLSREACAELQQVGEARFEKRLFREAVGFIAANPVRFLGRAAQRIAWLIFPWTADRRRDAIEWIIAAAGIVGCFVAIRRRHTAIWFLISGMGLYLLPYLLVQTSPRYRYPVWWLFVLLGMYGVRQLGRRLRHTTPPRRATSHVAEEQDR
jgi:hypothetical protein